jgi:hypothetical protein
VKRPIVTALTAIALALLAFYAGVALEAGRTTQATLQIPDTLPPFTTIARGGGTHSVWVTDTAVATAQSRTDWLQTFATAGGLVGAAFLLARLAIVIVRQLRLRRAA